MKKQLRYLVIFLSLCLGFIACKDIIEEDISEEEIDLFSPQDEDTLSSQVITFWWKEVEGAINYRFELIDPNGFPIKTSIQTGTQLQFSIDSLQKNENYTWRVRAENSSYESEFASRTFFVSELINIKNAKVRLNFPTDQGSIDLSAQEKFGWTSVNGASKYVIQISLEPFIANSVVDSAVTTLTEILPGAVINIDTNSVDISRKYYWRVRAFNDLYTTSFSTDQIFYLEK